MINISQLYKKETKGVRPVNSGRLLLVENHGVSGDAHSNGGDRQVCLLFSETKKQLDAMAEKPACVLRFYCNILLDGELTEDVKPGKRLKIGGVLLEISIVGRECHALCDLGSCPLVEGVVFAKVIRGGELEVGDEVKYA